MRPGLFLLRTWPGRRHAALAAITLVAAASLGLVLAASLGARRASTGWERLRQRTEGDDLLLDIESVGAARSVAERARAVPGVAKASAVAYAYMAPRARPPRSSARWSCRSSRPHSTSSGGRSCSPGATPIPPVRTMSS